MRVVRTELAVSAAMIYDSNVKPAEREGANRMQQLAVYASRQGGQPTTKAQNEEPRAALLQPVLQPHPIFLQQEIPGSVTFAENAV
jgi:hypothetical protein